MPTVLMSRISLLTLTPARPGLFTIAATSLTFVPSVLHGMAPRRVACELPGGVVLRSLYKKTTKTGSTFRFSTAAEHAAMLGSSHACAFGPPGRPAGPAGPPVLSHDGIQTLDSLSRAGGAAQVLVNADQNIIRSAAEVDAIGVRRRTQSSRVARNIFFPLGFQSCTSPERII
jgi:hypothetical protein